MGQRHFAKKPISNSDLLEQVYSIMNWIETNIRLCQLDPP
jgi:hypothetical protein